MLNDKVDELAKEGAMKTGTTDDADFASNVGGNVRNDGEYVFYEKRLKMCAKCKVPVNVCICESVFAKSSYDSALMIVGMTKERKD